MTRVVIRIQADVEGREYFSLDFPIQKPNLLAPLGCSPQDPPFPLIRNGQLVPERIFEAGQKLYQILGANAFVKQTLASDSPLYLYIQSELADQLPWEALCAEGDDGFFALGNRPIGRISDSLRTPVALERPLETPLRITAVLAATGVDATAEWHGLEKAIRATSVPVRLHLFLAQPALKQQIEASNPGVAVQLVTGRKELLDGINAANPHILHFFCHGSSEYGSYLEVATPSDWTVAQAYPQTPGSILLEHRDFEPPDIRKSVFLVTLNACESAQGNAEMNSLARSLIDVGIPVVIAMREPISTEVANLVTEEVYQSLFERIGELLAQPAPGDGTPFRGTIEWAGLLQKARHRIVVECARRISAGADPRPPSWWAREIKEWTLPTLYMRNTQLQLLRVGPADREQETRMAELNTLKKYLATLHVDTPLAVRQQLVLRIATLEQEIAT